MVEVFKALKYLQMLNHQYYQVTQTPEEAFEDVEAVLLDIDDTLWENNIFFLTSIEWLCRQGRLYGHCDDATLSILNHWEGINIPRMGFGYDSYGASYLMTIRCLAARIGDRHYVGGMYKQGQNWIKFLKQHPIVWRPGVLGLLPELTEKFKTIIVTKGHVGDQMGKVHRSGLRSIFHGAEAVPQKSVACYEGVLSKYNLDPKKTVMVGNSPKSDINQAKKAGLRTVYIPHPQTWYREMEPISVEGPETIELSSFIHLMDVLN